MADKYRYVASQGKIKKNEEGLWVFTPDPTKEKSDFHLTGQCKHLIVEQVFEILKENEKDYNRYI
jgi:hypothetical protein